MKILYDAGMGEKTSLGFGMVETPKPKLGGGYN